jgi:ketosteroid isomerase-like protein
MENLERTTLEKWVKQHLAAWEAGDVLAISAMLHPEIQFTLPAINWQGHGLVQRALERYLTHYSLIRFHLRRLLVDPMQQVAAVEWIGRFARSGENGCEEFLGGTVLDFDPAGLIVCWRTYLDPVRRRMLDTPAAPLPGEGWLPYPDPGPPLPRAAIEQFIQAYAQAWSNHDLAQINRVIHAEIVVQPPWDYIVGPAAFEAGARTYFANYTETCVTPHRLILDATQPYFGVCEQTFACTNPDTGQRGEDHDFAFFEMAQGKLRYWRTYFDTTRSAQVIEKTLGFLRQ